MRFMGFGDVAAILVPAVRHLKRQNPEASIDVLTYGAGVELMHQFDEVRAVLEVTREQWPNDLEQAIPHFLNIAEVILAQQYERIINLDTWFMPCFLARFLKDIGCPVEGNFINIPTTELMGQLARHELDPAYFQFNRFLGSSYPQMADWDSIWWQRFPVSGGYPAFYLQHCCNMPGPLDYALAIAEDQDFRAAAHGKKIIALSTQGSKANKQYPHAAQLTAQLQAAGYYVWSQFDGSLPLSTCLARLKASDLLITVPTSTQWLAKLVGCPTLMISGSLAPNILGAEFNLPKTETCQYCCQNNCDKTTEQYSCLDIAPEHIIKHIPKHLRHTTITNQPQLSPEKVRITLNKAWKKSQSGHCSEALDLYQQVLAHEPNNYDALLQSAIIFDEQDLAHKAIALFQQAAQTHAQFAQPCILLGNLLIKQQRIEDALQYYLQATAREPHNTIALTNTGCLFELNNDLNSAITYFDRAIASNPNYADAYCNRANSYFKLKQYHQALTDYCQAIQIDPAQSNYYYCRGITWQKLGKNQQALEDYQTALDFNAHDGQAWSNLGTIQKDMGLYAESLASHSHAIKLEPQNPDYYCNRGNTHQKLKQLEQAIRDYNTALELDQHNSSAYYNRGTAQHGMGHYPEALSDFNRAIELNPHDASSWCNRGIALKELGEYSEAMTSLNKALQLNPDSANIKWNQAQINLVHGQWREGFLGYEWRWQNPELILTTEPINFPQPAWTGQEDIAGKTILFYTEQGYGDTIQYLRFAKQVTHLGAKAVIKAQASLKTLLQNLDDCIQVIAKDDAIPHCDYQCPLMSIPAILGIDSEAQLQCPPYIKSSAEKKEYWARRLGDKTRPRIGIAWSGNRHHKNDKNRSAPLRDFALLFKEDSEYVVLQTEISVEEQDLLNTFSNVHCFKKEIGDFSDTAALIDLMDKVISVDTSVVHLAGALGKPVHVLLPYIPDWRWLLDRQDSPWYASAQLHRLQAQQTWPEFLQALHTSPTLASKI